MTKTAGDAAVDAATQNVSPLTKAAIVQKTGYGTSPVEEAKTNFFSQLGLAN